MAAAAKPLRLVAGLLPPPLIKPLRRYRDGRARNEIEGILSRREPPRTDRAESDFARLQREFHGVPPYGYDAHSIWRRGMERALILAELPPDRNRALRVLEVGCGDAMTGFALSLHGHQVTVSDMADWRDPRARSLPFCPRVLEDGLPFADGAFDLIFSYNSFEHFNDPAACFAELARLVAPSGIVHLSFGPLFASPWGLHADSSLKMPFPQFLFSEAFIAARLRQTGVDDLGRHSDALQPLNRWTLRQFCQLWSDERWRSLKSDLWGPADCLELIERYPECFAGRGLSYDDVTIQAITVTLERLGSQ